ncbi:Sarcosine oxidase, delta subunit family [Nonomuraea coxensis DSM 45129]|uniref:Sarcosine oxidase, delta subunit family n=1 Tax=Nonomuraea coxensis DSM 45129 TaxID=1122611 RepID=A0ABX8TW54_9ACTN|nr:sarcosine oxidase subunit delta [Nonomuraea coxensis]QYC39700.1 Sarcosine oxidase, delta subunit family [Nonomuraea coxensis DSM 45129]
MLLIPCPFCGPRDETEFRYGGQAGVPYPAGETTDAEWAAYVFTRDNPKGWFHERWFHAHGCRTWFTVERHTLTQEIR